MNERARKLHFDSIVVDGHADTISRFLDDGEDLGAETGRGHLDLPRMKRGGLDCQFLSCWVEPKYVDRGESSRRCLRMIDAAKRWAAACPDRLELARGSADVRRIAASGRIAGILAIEGGHAIEEDLALLRLYHELGVRYMTLTWNNPISWAWPARAKGVDSGLNAFGREVVREMNRLGMLVDLSHVSEKTFYDALETASVPAICSHSCARALCDHPRNLRDDQLRALARNGGVVGVNFYSGFLSGPFVEAKRGLDARDDEERAALRERLKDDPKRMDEELKRAGRAYDAAESAMPRPSFDVLLDHIDHMVRVAGVDHVGLGSDFDGVTALPEGVDDCEDLPLLTERLLDRGYSEIDVRKILGENFLRVLP